MELIRFIDSDNLYLVDFKPVNQKVVSLTFEKEIPECYLNGFTQLNKHNGVVEGEYPEFVTLYRSYEDNPLTVELSNDESVYTAPVVPDHPYIPEHPETDSEPYIPSFEEVRDSIINSLSNICQFNIEYGVDVLIDGIAEHFSYSKDEDQPAIKELFDTVMASGMPMYYHSDNNSCKLYTVEQIILIYTSCATNRLSQLTYFNQLKMYILNELTTVEELENVFYGQELTGKYLEVYNDALVKTKDAIMATMTKNANLTPTKSETAPEPEIPESEDASSENPEPIHGVETGENSDVDTESFIDGSDENSESPETGGDVVEETVEEETEE